MQTQVDSFPAMQQAVAATFKQVTAAADVLFTVSTEGLFQAYLDGFSDPEDRQHHNCNTCRRFIETYGGLVTLADDGAWRSAMWDPSQAPREFRRAIENMERLIDSREVQGIFYTKEARWGIPNNYSKKHGHDWEHFYVLPPAKFVSRDRLKTPHELSMLAQESYQMLSRALADFKPAVVAQALTLMKTSPQMRQERFYGPLQQFASIQGRSADEKWAFVARHPAAARIRSSVVGTLLQNLAAGMPVEVARNAFIQQVDPINYMRTQSAPKAGNLVQAEAAVAKLGLTESVKRRFADFSEVRGIAWKPRGSTYEKAVGGIFAKLYAVSATPSVIRGSKVTWVKFANEVLPHAEKIKYVVSPQRQPYAHITACEVSGQPSLFKWGHEYSLYRWVVGSLPADFDLVAGEEVDVLAVGLPPHMWDDNKSSQSGAVIYLSKGMDMKSAVAGLGIAPDTLRQDLHPYRASFEHLSKSESLSGMPGAAGIKLTQGEPVSITLAVTVGSITTHWEIDRWD